MHNYSKLNSLLINDKTFPSDEINQVNSLSLQSESLNESFLESSNEYSLSHGSYFSEDNLSLFLSTTMDPLLSNSMGKSFEDNNSNNSMDFNFKVDPDKETFLNDNLRNYQVIY